MADKKDVTAEVLTAKVELKALSPKVITVKKFLRWNWKYICATWTLTVAIVLIGCFLPLPLGPVLGILLSIIPFLLGTRAITKNTITEIAN